MLWCLWSVRAGVACSGGGTRPDWREGDVLWCLWSVRAGVACSGGDTRPFIHSLTKGRGLAGVAQKEGGRPASGLWLPRVGLR